MEGLLGEPAVPARGGPRNDDLILLNNTLAADTHVLFYFAYFSSHMDPTTQKNMFSLRDCYSKIGEERAILKERHTGPSLETVQCRWAFPLTQVLRLLVCVEVTQTLEEGV